MKILENTKEGAKKIAFCAYDEVKTNAKFYTKFTTVCMAVFLVCSFGMLAFAGSDIAGLGTTVTKVISDIYKAVFGVMTVLAALLCIIALIVRMSSSSQQSAEQATKWLKRILICYAIANCIGLIFRVIENTATSNNANYTP